MTLRAYHHFCDSLRSEERLRALRDLAVVSAREVEQDGERLLNFSSNNYLALSFHPQVIARSREFLETWGAGSTASRLVCGNSALHSRIEEKIAAAKGSETALLFSSGYQANVSVLAALFDKTALGKTPVVFSDRLNHASIHAGCALAGVREIRYQHNDLSSLETMLRKHDAAGSTRFILSETVFSMDGDIADVEGIRYLAQKYEAIVYLDEAHATGVLGENGFGLAQTLKESVPWIAMGTCSKALGTSGAYVAGPKVIKDYLVNRASGFIYSTAMPPAVLGAIDAAVDLVPTLSAERAHLLDVSKSLRQQVRSLGFQTGGEGTPIVPLILGENAAALNCFSQLLQKRIIAIPIRPPTVPEGTARLRLSLTAAHQFSDIELLCDALRPIAPNLRGL